MPEIFDENAVVKVDGGEMELATTSAMAEKQFEIQSAIVVAKRFPRNEDEAFQKLMKASSRPAFAGDSSYNYPRGGSQIEGPSINLAREAARVWGNIRYGLEILRDDDESRLIRAYAYDVETNTKVSAEDDFKKVIQRKGQGWIVPDERDLRELTNRRGAILVRTCLLQLLPKDLIADAMEECRKTLEKHAKEDPESAKKAMIKAFSGLNITPIMLETYLGHPVGQSSPAEIAELRNIYKSIADGNSNWSEYVSRSSEPSTGSLTKNNLKPSEQPNRGHDDTKLDLLRQPGLRSAGDHDGEGMVDDKAPQPTHPQIANYLKIWRDHLTNKWRLSTEGLKFAEQWMKEQFKVDTLEDVPDSLVEKFVVVGTTELEQALTGEGFLKRRGK